MADKDRARKRAIRPETALATFQFLTGSSEGCVSVAMPDDRARRVLQFVTLLGFPTVAPEQAFKESFG
ncbi:hypothetical protein Pan44_26520 [Caulifigura coniformis]|uniref:Uncharacterized protein n=1 Tax=Caulifigura coniformis TaxID=2527983 RepID=A0A517SEU6_9PLAN|nr:hypothetical protein [Caulifigura coniformis]QDT54617.1 hypothetical protein Pan44_26520 [Caulifigura coniformis]